MDDPDLAQSQVVPPEWFEQPTVVVAADLIGMVLCRRLNDGRVVRARITETEAYIGTDDRACHSHGNRRTARTEVMFATGGRIYVYLTYGLHYMLNIVTTKAGAPEAVLVRAAILESIDELPAAGGDVRLLAGPAKLTKALEIDKSVYGQLATPETGVWFERDSCDRPPIQLAPRIGIDYAGEAKDWLLRYVWQDHPSVSKPYRGAQTRHKR